MEQWQPIETCPLKKYVLLWCGFEVIGYQFENGKFTESKSRARHEIFHLTHWMPLPPPPRTTTR